jgi:protein-disulfide isomerase
MPSERLGRAAKLATVMVPTIVGLVASAMLLVDYVRPAPVFCDEDGGCAALKQSVFAYLGPIPLPAIGVFAFVVYAGLALSRGKIAHVGLALASSAAALLAVVLLGYQFSIGVFCKFCIVADVSTLLVAAAAWMRMRSPWELPPRSVDAFAWAAAVALAIGGPVAAGRILKPKTTIPPVVAFEREHTPKGKVAVVDFVDFECPFCRMTHEVFAPLLEERKDRVRVVRKQVPLRMHAHAMDAARAACCAEQLGHGDAMADALFKAPVAELTPDGCEKLASSFGMSLDAFRTCVADPATDARIKSDTEEFKAAKAHGLPTIWIGDQKIEGAQPVETLREALDDALAHAGS